VELLVVQLPKLSLGIQLLAVGHELSLTGEHRYGHAKAESDGEELNLAIAPGVAYLPAKPASERL